MLITVINQKGGVGKSSLSYTVSKDTNSFYYTNDKVNSINHLLLPRDKVLNKFDNKSIEDKVLLFDSGGFNEDTYIKIFNNGVLTDLETRFYNILKGSDLIIIPLEYCINSLYSTNNFLKKILSINKNVIFVINKYEEKKEITRLSRELFKNKISKDDVILFSKELFKLGIDKDIINKICNYMLKKYLRKGWIKREIINQLKDSNLSDDSLLNIEKVLINLNKSNITKKQIFTLPKSKAFKNMYEKNMSIKELYNDNNNVLRKKWYKKVYTEYMILLNYIESKIPENLKSN